jgi:hypothetical protein
VVAVARSPPASEPARSRFFRPSTKGLMARSTALLSIATLPSSRQRVSAGQRDSA